MKRIIPIVGLGLGAGTSAAIAMIARRRDDLRRDQNNRCSMTTVAGIHQRPARRADLRGRALALP
jgi:hypothetical protein